MVSCDGWVWSTNRVRGGMVDCNAFKVPGERMVKAVPQELLDMVP